MANWKPHAAPTPIDLDRMLLSAATRGGLAIPPYPAVALRIQEVVSRKEFGLDEVSRLVSSDPTLTANVLRCANSAMYSRGAPVTSLAQAITRIGARDVTRLALSSGLAAHVQAPGPLVALKRSVWIDSVASAVLCQELARCRRLRSEEGFALGLLHDFGKVVATAHLEALLDAHPSLGPRRMQEWAEVVERHHVAVGLAVAAEWKLPPLVTEVMSLHHTAGAEGTQDPALIEVVRCVDRVVAMLAERPHVASADLAEVPSLAPAERDEIARVGEQVPEFVAAFEAPAPAPARVAPPSMVAVPLTTLAPGQRAVTFGVTANVAKRPCAFVAAAIATNGLVVFGSEALPVNQLLEVSLDCLPKPFRIWATAKLCRTEGAGVHVELQPYALGGEARRLWNQLFMEAQPA
jgi:HD-like signal output (HDOD) protein